jgi:hypothetical protein
MPVLIDAAKAVVASREIAATALMSGVALDKQLSERLLIYLFG